MIHNVLKKPIHPAYLSCIAGPVYPVLYAMFLIFQCNSVIPCANAQTTKATSVATADEDNDLCYWFRAVNSDAPAFENADVSSRILFKLEKDEQICCFGQKNDFAVADVVKLSAEQRKSVEDARADVPPEEKTNIVYVKASDLAKVEKGSRSSSWLSQMLGYLMYWRQRGVPEDGLLPYRPIIDLFSTSNDK